MSYQNPYFEELLGVPVRTNMRADIPTVSPLEHASAVVDTMIREDSGAVVVVDDDRPIGIITEKDILERLIKSQRDFEKTLVRDVMSTPLITIEADHSISEALDIMGRNDIKRIVVTEEGALLGLTTERRLLEVAHEHYMNRTFNMDRGTPFNYLERVRVAFVSTYPPRECGIATYTENLIDAISRLHVLKPPIVLAINDKGGFYNYGREVEFQIDRDRVESYVEAAEYVNWCDIDVVNLQHEYGLFGGSWGEHVLAFLERLKKPVVTTLHTLLTEPVPDARRILKEIIRHSNYVIVMARVGMHILEQSYDTLSDRSRYLPHGCPNVPFINSEPIKKRLNLEKRTIISTFGLLSRGKGIEYAIQALPKIVEEDPQVLYLIIGETHPEVRKAEGESYRRELIELVENLGLDGNVRFVNDFLPINELLRYLQATDIYVIPYPNREQISSGTLLYALSTGKAIVSTPFLHAEEVISEGCAMGCDFRDPESITRCLRTLIHYNDFHRRLEMKAYDYSRGMIWPNVAMKYVNIFYEALGM